MATLTALGALGVAAPAAPATDPSSYSITDLGTLSGANDTDSAADGVNASGVVIGHSGPYEAGSSGHKTFTSRHAFIWRPTTPNAITGAIADLGGLPGYLCGPGGQARFDTLAYAINATSQVAGTSWTGPPDCGQAVFGSANFHAALYGQGPVDDLGAALDAALFAYTSTNLLLVSDALGINDAGRIVGRAVDASDTYHAWLFDTEYHDLGALHPGYALCSPSQINNRGQVVGSCQANDFSGVRGFLHTGNAPLAETDDVGAFSGGTNTFAVAVNDLGVVVGAAQLATGETHAFRLGTGGSFDDLGALDSGTNSSANAINDANVIVGTSDTGTTQHAVIWTHDAPAVDLNTLIDPDLGWELTSATGINDRGQIVGAGMRGGHLHAYLMTRCGAAGGDSDGDGLCDDWERFGLQVPDKNGSIVGFLNLPAMGADPNHKDVFVQVDYMVASDHTHQPKPGAFDAVVGAFANAPVTNPDMTQGINLHVDCGPDCVMNPVTGETWGALSQANALEHSDVIGSIVDGKFDWTSIDAIKADNLPPERVVAFHYAVFAHDLGVFNTDGTRAGFSGIAHGLPSSDFIVSLGSRTGMVGTKLEQGGTFMHELGHTLGLHHGGLDDVNFKPNYLSVMNYFFQSRGLLQSGANGTLDYSQFALPDLDEHHLDEQVGLDGGADIADFGTYHICPGQHGELGARTPVLQANAPIDWNCNSGIESDVAANINGDTDSTGADVLGTLSSSVDWSHLVFDGGAIGDLGERLPQSSAVEVQQELTPDDEAAIPHPFDVQVTCPGITSVPAGGNTTLRFSVGNTGLEADTYDLTRTTTAAWVDLTGVPATLHLAAATGTDLLVPVAVPAGVAAGTTARVVVEATSQQHRPIEDVCVANLRVTPPSSTTTTSTTTSTSTSTTTSTLPATTSTTQTTTTSTSITTTTTSSTTSTTVSTTSTTLPPGPMRLFVCKNDTGDVGGGILRFDGTSGAPVGLFGDTVDATLVASTGAGTHLSGPRGIAFGGDGHMYVTGTGGGVQRFDPSSGANAGIGGSTTDASWAVRSEIVDGKGIAVGADGRVYASDGDPQRQDIKAFDPATGTRIADFVPAGFNVDAFVFASEGTALVIDPVEFGQPDPRILRYELARGKVTFLVWRTQAPDGGLTAPEALQLGRDGRLYVASAGTNAILRYDATTGAFIDAFVPGDAAHNGGLQHPAGLVFGPGGDLYVSSYDTGAVLRYDGATGAFRGAFVAAGSGGLTHPRCLGFYPAVVTSRSTTTTTSTSTSTTTTVPLCGNGVLDPSEACDPRAAPSGCSPGTSCSADCRCVPLEICGNCTDDDHNGAADFEDAACCSHPLGMTIAGALVKPAGSGSHLVLRAVVAGASTLDPTKQDVTLQLRADGMPDALCAVLPAAHFSGKGRLFTFADKGHRVPGADAIDKATIKLGKDGSATITVVGKRAAFVSPPQGRVQLTVGFHAAGTDDRCARASQTFRPGRKGAIVFP